MNDHWDDNIEYSSQSDPNSEQYLDNVHSPKKCWKIYITYPKQIPLPLFGLTSRRLLWKVPRLGGPGGKDDVEDALNGEDDDGDHPDQVPLVSVTVVTLHNLSRHSRGHKAWDGADTVCHSQYSPSKVGRNVLTKYLLQNTTKNKTFLNSCHWF